MNRSLVVQMVRESLLFSVFVRLIDLINLECLESTYINCPLLGEGAPPFIDEGDGLTREREKEYVY